LVHRARRHSLRAPRRDADPARRRVQHHRREIRPLERRARARRLVGSDRRLYPARPQLQRIRQLPLLRPRKTMAMTPSSRIAAALLALALPAAPAMAHPPITDRAPADEQAAFEADR